MNKNDWIVLCQIVDPDNYYSRIPFAWFTDNPNILYCLGCSGSEFIDTFSSLDTRMNKQQWQQLQLHFDNDFSFARPFFFH